MYKVEKRVFSEGGGIHTEWRLVGVGYVNTMEEAMRLTKKVRRGHRRAIGDWRIVSRSIDEETFAVRDSVVVTYDWWKEVGRYKCAEDRIKQYSKIVKELESRSIITQEILNEIEKYRTLIDIEKSILQEKTSMCK